MRPARLLPLPVLIVVCFLAAACAEGRARALDELSVVDSLYVDPVTGQPFTGSVSRRFDEDSTAIQIEGRLLEGVWDGEMIVYHPNGRVRYMGNFENGDRCGAWIENADSLPLDNVYEELVREVETMGLYPPCEGG